jgi:hypothetical protein
MEMRFPTNALSKEDFPTFGRPTIAITGMDAIPRFYADSAPGTRQPAANALSGRKSALNVPPFHADG